MKYKSFPERWVDGVRGGIGQTSFNKAILDIVDSPVIPLPVIDYVVMVGSSSTFQTYTTNPILGGQRNNARAAFCAEGLDVPIIVNAVGGATIASVKDTIAASITALGPFPVDKKVGFIVHIGSNDIGHDTYETAPQEKRDQMRNDLITILTIIRDAGHEPILTTSTCRNGEQAKFESWMDGLYHPLAVEQTPAWTRGGRCVFDYTQLYRDNLDTPDWYNPDNTHPWMATPAMQVYTAQVLNQYAQAAQIAYTDRFIFKASTTVIGGFNNVVANGTLASIVDAKGQAVSGASITTAATAGGSISLSTSTRGNAGVYDVSLLNYGVHSANRFVSTPSAARQQWTIDLGSAYANRTGTLRATINSSMTPRRTRVTLPDATFVDIQGETGIDVGSLPFEMSGSGVLLVDMYRVTSGVTAISGIDIVFD